MKHNLYRIFIMTGILLASQHLFAQTQTLTLQYKYDATGNRTQRRIAPATGNIRKGAVMQKDSLGKISITLAPNPTTGLLKITMDNFSEGTPAATISVYDLTGKQIIQKQGITGAVEIDLSQYASGAYLLKMSSGEKTTMWNIVKE